MKKVVFSAPVTLIFSLLCLLCHGLIYGPYTVRKFLDYATGNELLAQLWFYAPAVDRGEYWRIISSAFIHANSTHLLSNLIFILFFGIILEKNFLGSTITLLLFIASVVGANCFIALSSVNSAALGASGICYGLVAALIFYSLMTGKSVIPALIFAGVTFATQFSMDEYSRGTLITHTGGFVGAGGVLLTLWITTRYGRNTEATERGVGRVQSMTVIGSIVWIGFLIAVLLSVSSVG